MLNVQAGCQKQVEIPEEMMFKAFSDVFFPLLNPNNLAQMLHTFSLGTITQRKFTQHPSQTKASDG